MSSNHRVRFRLWHLFVMVTVASTSVCCFTQIGMVTAEIEIIDVGSISEIGAANDDPDAPQEIVNVVFQYVRPEDMANTRLNLFLQAPTETAFRIKPGDRFKFRYRARPFLWLKPTKPDSSAIGRLGLTRDDIEEIINEIRMPGEIS